MSDFSDLIQKAWRRLEPIPPATINITADYTAGSNTITFDHTSLNFNSVVPGALVTLGLNVLIVTGAPNGSTGVTAILGGQQGSTDVSVDYDLTANSAQCFIQPRFTPWDISVAINDELKALTTPKSGIGQILTSDQTFVPVYMGYDLGSSFDPVRSRVLEITFALPAPMRQNPLIRRGEYRVIRATNQPGIFPSGNGVLIYRDAFVGFPIHITQLAPFQPLVNLTDSLQTVAGVPIYMEDIVEFGAVLRLAPDREIQRNSLAFQRDPRKAAEVPATAQMHSIDALQRRYQSRLDDEAANIKYAYKQSEGW